MPRAARRAGRAAQRRARAARGEGREDELDDKASHEVRSASRESEGRLSRRTEGGSTRSRTGPAKAWSVARHSSGGNRDAESRPRRNSGGSRRNLRRPRRSVGGPRKSQGGAANSPGGFVWNLVSVAKRHGSSKDTKGGSRESQSAPAWSMGRPENNPRAARDEEPVSRKKTGRPTRTASVQRLATGGPRQSRRVADRMTRRALRPGRSSGPTGQLCDFSGRHRDWYPSARRARQTGRSRPRQEPRPAACGREVIGLRFEDRVLPAFITTRRRLTVGPCGSRGSFREVEVLARTRRRAVDGPCLPNPGAGTSDPAVGWWSPPTTAVLRDRSRPMTPTGDHSPVGLGFESSGGQHRGGGPWHGYCSSGSQAHWVRESPGETPRCERTGRLESTEGLRCERRTPRPLTPDTGRARSSLRALRWPSARVAVGLATRRSRNPRLQSRMPPNL
jgi:hypothetical protein